MVHIHKCHYSLGSMLAFSSKFQLLNLFTFHIEFCLQMLQVSAKGECQINESKCVILDLGHDFCQFYSLVRSSLQAVHASNGNSSKLKDFACLAQER